MELICPVCQQTLQLSADQRQLRCKQNHSFDRARQGYWNLLLAQKKRSKDPGDNPEMVSARERFLSAGFYQPVSDALNQLAFDQLKVLPTAHPQLIDLGCGEGYYTQALEQHLTQQGISPDIFGLDISKHAIKAACRRSKTLTWAVGSSAQIPVAEHSVDLATILFSRVLSAPLSLALKPGGKVILGFPGSTHLYSLREQIYDQVQDKPFDPQKQLGESYQQIDHRQLSYQIRLEGTEQIADLLAMTPHGQRIRAEKRAQILSQPLLETEVDIQLAVFERIT